MDVLLTKSYFLSATEAIPGGVKRREGLAAVLSSQVAWFPRLISKSVVCNNIHPDGL